MVSDKPDYSDKLFATINVMRQKVGQEEEAERILLKACQEIYLSIYGVVCNEAQIMFSQLMIITHSYHKLELLFAVPNMCMVSDKPDYSDKLFATINVMRQKVGQEEEAERILLKACQEIHVLFCSINGVTICWSQYVYGMSSVCSVETEHS
jgi:hypothetical protein